MNMHTPALRDLGFLGFWSWDFRTGIVDASAELNDLFGVCPDLDGEPTDIGRYEVRVHPDDLEWLRRERPRCFGPSGHGVVEYRVIDELGRIRWVMCRAIYDTDDDGHLISARGMMTDVTSFKADGNSPRTAPARLEHPLNALVDAALAAFEAAQQMGHAELKGLLKTVLQIAGQELAQDLARRGSHSRH